MGAAAHKGEVAHIHCEDGPVLAQVKGDDEARGADVEREVKLPRLAQQKLLGHKGQLPRPLVKVGRVEEVEQRVEQHSVAHDLDGRRHRPVQVGVDGRAVGKLLDAQKPLGAQRRGRERLPPRQSVTVALGRPIR